VTHPPLPMNSSLQRAAVHGLYQALQGSPLRPGDLATEWYDRNRDQQLSQRELTDAFSRDNVVVALNGRSGIPATLPNVQAVAERVAGWMDAADGRQDGWIDFRDSQSPTQPTWPERRLPTHEVARNLASGDWVIGTQLMERREASFYGKTVTEVQDGAQAWPTPISGPILVRAFN
jgi:hypothetical protein